MCATLCLPHNQVEDKVFKNLVLFKREDANGRGESRLTAGLPAWHAVRAVRAAPGPAVLACLPAGPPPARYHWRIPSSRPR